MDALQAHLCDFAVGGGNLLIDGGSIGCVILDLRHMKGIVVWDAVVENALAFFIVKLGDGNLLRLFR